MRSNEKRGAQWGTRWCLLPAGALLLLMILSLWQRILIQPVFAQETDTEETSLVLTALPVTYSLTTALLQNTPVTVENLPARGRRLNGLSNYFSSSAERLQSTFLNATAVVTIGKLWSGDPLYTAARQANIRIVEIDATQPWSNSMEGIAVAVQPQQLAPWSEGSNTEAGDSIWFWLSLTNAVRSTDIIARDLQRLFPDSAETIQINQLSLRNELLSMLREYELRLASASDITVFSLAPELVYLTNELGLFVDGSFFVQDIDWTEADAQAFENYLRDNRIPVVLHKWEPDELIKNAIAAAGARLVVLETLDAGIVEGGQMTGDSYMQLMRQNLEALVLALD